MSKTFIFYLKRFLIGLLGFLFSYFLICFIIYEHLSSIQPGHGDDIVNTPLCIQFNDGKQSNIFGPVLAFKSLDFLSHQGNTLLSAWFIPHDRSESVMVVSHGHGNSKADPDIIKTAWVFYQLGFNVFLYDFQNHGSSAYVDGRTQLGSTEYLDVLGAKNACEQMGFESDNIYFYGLSFGGAATLIAAQYDHEIHTVIVDGAFSNVDLIIKEELARRHIPTFFYYGTTFIAQDILQQPIGTESPDFLSKTNLKHLLVIHAKYDGRVGFHHAKHLIDAAKQSHISYHPLFINSTKHGKKVFLFEDEYHQFFTTYLNVK